MALCEQCGSIRLVRARSGAVDRGLAKFTSLRPFTCRRCGWRGRRAWTEADIVDPNEYGVAIGATTDPALSTLDNPASDRPAANRPKTTRKRKPRKTAAAKPKASTEFDLSEVGWNEAADLTPADTPSSLNGAGWDERTRRIVEQRLKRSNRQQIVGTIAMSALALFVFSLLSISRSCGAPDL